MDIFFPKGTSCKTIRYEEYSRNGKHYIMPCQVGTLVEDYRGGDYVLAEFPKPDGVVKIWAGMLFFYSKQESSQL